MREYSGFGPLLLISVSFDQNYNEVFGLRQWIREWCR